MNASNLVSQVLRVSTSLKWATLMVLSMVAYVAAFLLRFDGTLGPEEVQRFLQTLPVLLVMRGVAIWHWGLQRKWWRFVSMPDVTGVLAAAGAGSVGFVLIQHFGRLDVPRSVLLMEFCFFILLAGGIMVASRSLHEGRPAVRVGRGRRALIVGAGRAGDRIARELRHNVALDYVPVAFVDDDPMKKGCVIQGVPVLGTVADLPRLATEYKIQEIIIAMPSARGRRMRELVEICEAAGVRFRVLPATSDVMNGTVQTKQLREVRIEDLLPRSPIALDLTPVRPLLEASVVCVTGAGGSIGSELCRQIAACRPSMLVMVDRYENNLYYLEQELKARFPDLVLRPVVADITDLLRMERLISSVRPRVIFQAAACKHVPLMEQSPTEAVKNNVYGTRVLARLAELYGVERFVMISTDKAINPTSVMGASKRLAELVLQGMQPKSRTRFITVRFGNVLGSEGSVVQLFQRQIAAGGPLTVTHPNVVRYFMSVDEAVRLVLHAGVLGEGGEIFLLDMGEPARILDLARAMIRLSGVETHDEIEIRFTGLRPGEKISEELTTESEETIPTVHPRIMRLREQSTRDWQGVQGKLVQLERLALAGESASVRDGIRALVPEYQPTGNGHAIEGLPFDGSPPPAAEDEAPVAMTGGSAAGWRGW